MQTENRVLMQQAREALKGKWGLAVGASFVVMLITVVTRFIPVVGVIASLLIAGPLALGLAMFWLSIARGQEVTIAKMFDGFNHFVNAALAYFMMIVYILLWSLLLIVPGIIASFSYAMTFFVLADDPSMRAKDAIAKSKQLMQGNKMRFFILGFYFIGWSILAVLTLGIGFLWLLPYMQVTYAKFYEDIKAQAVTTEAAPV